MNTKTSGVIAIHDGGGWNARWIQYCLDNGIPHKVVNAYENDVIEKMRGCGAFMWHFHHSLPQDILMSRNVLNSAAKMGLRVFPDYDTNWHFDDKLSQKYLFEAMEIPAANAWAFFNPTTALAFANTCELPIVAKLRRGAGSHNVRLLATRSEVKRYVKRMFGRGYRPSMSLLTDVRRKVTVSSKSGMQGLLARIRNMPRYIRVVNLGRKYFDNEKGYVYFQEFIPDNHCDIRIGVVGNRAWGYRRMVRSNDFRASGSGVNDYDVNNIPLDLVRLSFQVAERLNMMSAFMDWVVDKNGEFKLLEISYGTPDDLIYDVTGYWDRSMYWHEGHIYPSIAVIEDMVWRLNN